MLHVLRHYLPFRTAMLVLSETVLITLVVMIGMSSHLWSVGQETARDLAFLGLSPEDALWRCFFSSLMVSVLAQITISFNELYDFRISSSMYERAARFFGAAGSAVLLCIVCVALADTWKLERILDFPGLPLSQRVVLLTSALFVAFVLLYLWRNLFHAWLRHTRFNERLLILGSGRMAQRLVDYLLSRPDSGYEIVGMIAGEGHGGDRRVHDRRRSDRRGRDSDSGTGNPWFEAALEARGGSADDEDGGPPGGRAEPAPAPAGAAAPARSAAAGAGPAAAALAATEVVPRARLFRLPGGAPIPEEEAGEPLERAPLHELARRLEVADVIVALEERRGSLPTQDLLRCRLDGIVVEEVESFFERLTGKIPAEAMRPSYLIFNKGFIQHPLAQAAKRAIDVGMALLGILLTWPLMAITALLVRFDSPGPILFRQVRTGQLGRPFTLCKFRSMRADAEKLTGPVWASKDDPRITRVGRFLRKTRLDELPQLFNVLAGSMSLVGPRPERPNFVEELAQQIPYYHQRHIVKPGVTGWAQINYPYGNTVEDALQKLQYDLFYIKYQSILFDLSIVFNTIKTVVLRKGT